MKLQQTKPLSRTRKDAWWLWNGLQCEVQQQCEMLIDSEYFESPLPPLAKDAVLSYAQPWYERLMIALRCTSGDYMMNVLFDPDHRDSFLLDCKWLPSSSPLDSTSSHTATCRRCFFLSRLDFQQVPIREPRFTCSSLSGVTCHPLTRRQRRRASDR